MPMYSHSKISTFEQCPLKFKYRYIDKIKPLVEKTIEAHLGSAVHSALEWLYAKTKDKVVPTIDELIVKYTDEWQKDFKDNFLIVKKELSAQDYFNKGVEFLVTYYLEHKPFEDNTIEVEKEIFITLDPDGKYKVRGFIDRLAYNLKTNEYEIHDYKTANSPPSKERLEKDRQLALYSIAIKELFGADKEICLVWHYLAFNKRIRIRKSNKQLSELKQETIKKIKKIEAATEFPPHKSRLCDWCEYKSICPAWGNTPPENSQKSFSQKKLDLDKYPTLKKYLKD